MSDYLKLERAVREECINLLSDTPDDWTENAKRTTEQLLDDVTNAWDGLIAEQNRLKRLAKELANIAESFRRDCGCEHLHHSKGQYHKAGEPCPVEAAVDAVIADALKVTTNGKSDTSP
jgi:hypothetical protein